MYDKRNQFEDEKSVKAYIIKFFLTRTKIIVYMK